LVRDHPKRVHVAVLCGVAVPQTESRGIQQFRCRVSDVFQTRKYRGSIVQHVNIKPTNCSVVSQARPKIGVDQDVRLGGIESTIYKTPIYIAYWFKVAVDHVHRMQVLQSNCCFCELIGYFRPDDRRKTEIARTRRIRLTSGYFEVKAMMFPPTIHTDTMHSGDIFGETPNTGRTFGWESRLHITISWNRCYSKL
jgi:hypothetical protein